MGRFKPGPSIFNRVISPYTGILRIDYHLGEEPRLCFGTNKTSALIRVLPGMGNHYPMAAGHPSRSGADAAGCPGFRFFEQPLVHHPVYSRKPGAVRTNPIMGYKPDVRSTADDPSFQLLVPARLVVILAAAAMGFYTSLLAAPGRDRLGILSLDEKRRRKICWSIVGSPGLDGDAQTGRLHWRRAGLDGLFTVLDALAAACFPQGG